MSANIAPPNDSTLPPQGTPAEQARAKAEAMWLEEHSSELARLRDTADLRRSVLTALGSFSVDILDTLEAVADVLQDLELIEELTSEASEGASDEQIGAFMRRAHKRLRLLHDLTQQEERLRYLTKRTECVERAREGAKAEGGAL